MQKLDMEDYLKSCPECESIMRGYRGTRAEMNENLQDDNVTEIMWWECLDCDYAEEQV